MKYSVKAFEKDFSKEESKQAYLKLCKWLAKNVISNVEFSKNITYQIEKVEGKLPTFKLTLFATIEEEDIADDYCLKCKQLSNLLYSNIKPDCEHCKMSGYMKKKREYINSFKEFYKEVLKEK